MIVTGYERGDVGRIERMVGAERARWFSSGELRRCDEIVERMYGKKDDGNEGGNEGSHDDGKLGTTVRDIYEDDANVLKLGAPVVHWGTSPNRPEDNAAGDPNAFWFSFSPGLVSGEGSIGKGSAVGVGVVDGAPEPGRFAITGEDGDQGRFRTPGLRMLTRTAPYMHDGSLATLAEVVEFYREGGKANSHLSERMGPVELTDDEAAQLVAFLEALSR